MPLTSNSTMTDVPPDPPEQHSPESEDHTSNTHEMDHIGPLVNALLFTTTPGNPPGQLLSMHVYNSIKKCIWAGQYIDLAYLLETQLVPEDDKA